VGYFLSNLDIPNRYNLLRQRLGQQTIESTACVSFLPSLDTCVDFTYFGLQSWFIL
jgi:hypothetical protein